MGDSMKFVFDCVKTGCMICESYSYSVAASGKDYEYGTSDQEFTFVTCGSCGHLYLNPRPADHCMFRAYPSNYYTVSGRHTSKGSKIVSRFKTVVVNRRLRYFKELLQKKNARVLEVGCGDGSLLAGLKMKNPGLDAEGIDVALGMDTISRCKKLGINVSRISVEETELTEASLDLIIMNQVIEHVADPQAVMKKLAKALKPGGFISIETPDRDGYDRKLFRKSLWGGYYFPRHLHLFDRACAAPGRKIARRWRHCRRTPMRPTRGSSVARRSRCNGTMARCCATGRSGWPTGTAGWPAP
jgi:ubiquinone/menaquinone biosynthesis C-methylase UbiE